MFFKGWLQQSGLYCMARHTLQNQPLLENIEERILDFAKSDSRGIGFFPLLVLIMHRLLPKAKPRKQYRCGFFAFKGTKAF